MPLFLVLLGVLFLTAAVRGNKCDGQQCSDLLFSTLKDDFTGPNNFIYWGIALFVIGAAGYYKPFKPLSNAFLILVIVVLLLSNRGFFEKFMYAIGSTRNAPQGQDNASWIGDLSTAIQRMTNDANNLAKGL